MSIRDEAWEIVEDRIKVRCERGNWLATIQYNALYAGWSWNWYSVENPSPTTPPEKRGGRCNFPTREAAIEGARYALANHILNKATENL